MIITSISIDRYHCGSIMLQPHFLSASGPCTVEHLRQAALVEQGEKHHAKRQDLPNSDRMRIPLAAFCWVLFQIFVRSKVLSFITNRLLA